MAARGDLRAAVLFGVCRVGHLRKVSCGVPRLHPAYRKFYTLATVFSLLIGLNGLAQAYNYPQVYKPVVGKYVHVNGKAAYVAGDNGSQPSGAGPVQFQTAQDMYAYFKAQSGFNTVTTWVTDPDTGESWPSTVRTEISAWGASVDQYAVFPCAVIPEIHSFTITGNITNTAIDDAVPYDTWYALLDFGPPPPPPPPEDEDMTDPQMTAIFTQMSSNTSHVVAANTQLMETLVSAARMAFGGLLALVTAVTWKG